MRRFLDALYLGAGWLAALFMVGVLLMVLVSIGSRLAGIYVPGTDAYAGYAMAGAGFLALAHTLKQGEHIRVTLLIGRLTGRGNTTNLEQLLLSKPDLIVDAGSTRQTFVELADRVQAQTGIPYALLDGRLEATARGYTLLGELTGRVERAATLARYAQDTLRTVRERVARATSQPRVYYARGPEGLETGRGGYINVEMFEAMGIRHVAAGLQGGLATVSIEQVLGWDPEVIVTIDQTFAQTVATNPLWRGVSAVKSGRVHLSPKLPFGWIDFPPSVNRLPGLWWLGSKVFPSLFPEDLATLTRDFYKLFYQVDLSAAQVQRVLAGRS